MNSNRIKKVVSVLICALMLIQCGAVAFADDIAQEAVVYVRPTVDGFVVNQIGSHYLYFDVTTTGSEQDQSVMGYILDDNDNMVAMGHGYVLGDMAEVEIGMPGNLETGSYTVVFALNKAEDVFYGVDEVFYSDVEDVEGFLAAINMTGSDWTTVKTELDDHYSAISAVKCTEDADGNVILKITGDEYTNLSDEAKEAFAKLILNGVNGAYSADKGSFTAKNAEQFVKDAYITTVYNNGGLEDQALADIMYEFSSVIGFDAEDANRYGKIDDKAGLAKAVKTMAATVNNAADLLTVLNKAAAIQIVNEQSWLNRANMIAANNDIFNIDPAILSAVQVADGAMASALSQEFHELFNAQLYYSVTDLCNAFYTAYNTAVINVGGTVGGSGGSGGSGSGNKVTTNTVNTQVMQEENKKDPNVEIKDYYDDMSGKYSWASDAVLNLSKSKLISGYGDRTFRPGNDVTRAEFMKMLVNVFGLADITATSSFSDVDKDAWYYIYVASAEKVGIAQGYGNGLFGINDPVTRQDAITLIYRAAMVKGISLEKFTASASSLVDRNEIAQYALKAVESLYNAGVFIDATDPTSINKFEPTRNASRAYLALVLNQVYIYMK